MPPRSDFGTDQFNFDLAAPPDWLFTAGDTITGNLVRKTPIVTPEATITISLRGSAQIELFKKSKNPSYHDYWNLLDPAQRVLYKGPMHLAEDSNETLTWQFSVNIPLNPVQSCTEGHRPEASFLPLDKANREYQVLPGTFFAADTATNTRGFVEYFLIAHLNYKSKGRPESFRAIHRVSLRNPPEVASNRHMTNTLHQSNIIQSYRLLPRMENMSLSLTQKMQRFWNPSIVPKCQYTVSLAIPTVIQLNDSDPIPVQLEIKKRPENTSVNLHDTPQNFQLESAEMFIRSRTALSVPRKISKSSEATMYWNETNLNLGQAFRELEDPLFIMTGEESNIMHIGKKFQLVLRPTGLFSEDRRLSENVQDISPDFKTYCIKNNQVQRWEINLNIAGESHKHIFWSDLKIVTGL
ncbi:hypothetical protein N7478_009522 [Penicillium angulare]|uniref:uncharacterized protein n=1 Tax=Penicillium angulare TaxID=116970 RepID=UPI002541B67A|nr:uncharacterized protein N7478_009522 [Penicillium angulare]KAJ5266714.1 hypothetical protein N7478_009522 [Penicillium angulare]